MASSKFKDFSLSDSLFDIEIPTRFHSGIKDGKIFSIIKRGRRDVSLGDTTGGSSLSGDGMNLYVSCLRICKVRDFHLGDARASGFSSVQNLKVFLNRVYEDLEDSDEMTQIMFNYIGGIKTKRS